MSHTLTQWDTLTGYCEDGRLHLGNALDKENEERIQEAIEALDGKLTIIVIAHNQSSIEHIQQHIRLGSS